MCLFMQTLSGKKVISLELKAKMNSYGKIGFSESQVSTDNLVQDRQF